MKRQLDQVWAEAFFECNIPFSTADKLKFREAIDKTARLGRAAGLKGGAYELPHRETFRVKLLDEAHERETTDMLTTLRRMYTQGKAGTIECVRFEICV